MVDWDRVEQLRSKGWDWDEVAEDPKVGFQADQATGDPGRALRVLYHRRLRRGADKQTTTKPDKNERDRVERKWSLLRVGYLVVPLIAVWFVVAFLAPSPVGLILPAIPYVALVLAVVGFVLIYALLRSVRRWSPVFRTTLIGGIVLGLIFTAIVALAGILIFGCPYLPSAASLANQPGPGWKWAPVSPWQDGGKVVVYFYGSTWCPYCSASSWAVWKALTEYGSVTGASLSFSSSTDVYAGTPEVILANLQVASPTVSFQVNEDTSGVGGNFPGTNSCYQSAYYSAYGGSAIPFLAINGQGIHGGSSLINPTSLSGFTSGATNGAGAGWVQVNVTQELTGTNSPWLAIQGQSWWIMAYIAKGAGLSAAAINAMGWTAATKTAVISDLAQIG